ncbi:MAG: class I SAM-dependent methyltransferase [Thermoguttaceae bacterium]|jgi:SAM-dependent methyltransferase
MNVQRSYARFAKFYDAYTAQYTNDIPFYLAAVAGSQPPLLEIGCGSGRILVALLRSGHSVTGVDISEEMLALAQRKLKQEPLGPNGALVLHDFAKGPLPGRYGAALITFYTFNYIHPSERLAFLEHLGRNVVEGAPVILHLFYPATLAHPELEGKWQDKGCYQIEGREVRLYDCRRMLNGYTEERCQRYEMSMGASEEIQTVRYYLPPVEMAGLLSAAGFARLRLGWDLRYDHLEPLAGRDGPSGEYMVVAERVGGR